MRENRAAMEEISVREARREDVEEAANLVVRMKRLNNEFDPLFTVVDDAPARARSYLSTSLESKSSLVLVAVKGKSVVGVLRAEVRERTFYKPTIGGNITDFYILPEHRRKALGNTMLERASKTLRKLGAQVVTAEFPARNEIAVKFYSKRRFRALTNIYAESTE